jgi:hypothetical protein
MLVPTSNNLNGQLGTLGEARGKLTFLQRYDYNFLPATENKRFGIHLPPSAWTDNSPVIEIVYNTTTNQIAFIEDYYEIDGLPNGSGPAENIQWKFNATTAHIENATLFNPDQLYISFASSEHDDDTPPETPRVRPSKLSTYIFVLIRRLDNGTRERDRYTWGQSETPPVVAGKEREAVWYHHARLFRRCTRASGSCDWSLIPIAPTRTRVYT